MQDLRDAAAKWSRVVRAVTEAVPSRGALLQSSRVKSFDGRTLAVELPEGSSFALRMLEREDARGVVEAVARTVFGECAVTFSEEGGRTVEIPASEYARLKETEWHVERLVAEYGGADAR